MIDHYELGQCIEVMHFTGEQNQLMLVQTFKNESDIDVDSIYFSGIKQRKQRKQRKKTLKYWILWGPKEISADRLGYSFISTKGVSAKKAMQIFMKTSKHVDIYQMNVK